MLTSAALTSLLWAVPLVAAPLAQQPAAADAQTPKVLINPALYADIAHYAHFAGASYKVPCPSPPFGTSIVKYENIAVSSTQSTVFRDDARRELVVAFPGTATVGDSITDGLVVLAPLISPGATIADCEGCLVHAGVLLAYDSISSALQATLDRQLKAHPGYRVVIAGHSLGGSLASVAYASLSGLKYDVAAAYTYGQPRVGDVNYADHIDKLAGATAGTAGVFYRSTHANDGVPLTPVESLGYRHSLGEYWELDAPDGDETAGTTYRCFGQEPSDCVASEGSPFSLGPGHGYYGGVYMGTGTVCGIPVPDIIL